MFTWHSFMIILTQDNVTTVTAIFLLVLEWIIKESQPKHSASFSDVLFEILSVLLHYISLSDVRLCVQATVIVDRHPRTVLRYLPCNVQWQ